MLPPSDAAALLAGIEAVAAVAVEEVASVSTAFCPGPPVSRAAKASATTAFEKTASVEQVKGKISKVPMLGERKGRAEVQGQD